MEVAHLAVEHGQTSRCVLDEKPEDLLALTQGFVGTLALGDVFHERHV